MTDMTSTVEQILTAYVDRWNDYDAEGMIPFWDTEDEGIIYVAEEIEALHGWNALEKYFRGSDPATTDHYIAFWDVTARTIAPGVIQAFWNMSWNVYFSTEKLYAKPIGGEVRVTADSQAMTVPVLEQSYTVPVYELQPASTPRLK